MEISQKKAGNYLSIDGGLTAACGLCALYILNEMFERLHWDLKSETMPLPCELFDMIIGSGFGGIIALLLGPLRLSPSQAIDAYEKLIPVLSVGPAIDDDERKRNAEAFEMAFSAVLVDAGLPVGAPMIDKDASKTVVCTLRTNNAATPHLLRSYRSRGNAPPDCTILQAACASVASLDRFLPVTLGVSHRRIDLMDAVAGYANPTQLLLREAQNVFDDAAKVATVISVGLGKLRVSAIPDDSQASVITERLKQVIANCEQVHHELYDRLNNTGVYFRFGLGQELEAEDSILSSTLTYLEDGETNKRMNEAAKSIQCRPEIMSLKDINSATALSFELKPRPSLVDNFVGREGILEALRTTHFSARSPDLRKPAVSVLMGLGGSGKTQIALKFALEYERRDHDASVYFFNAASEDKLKADFELAIRARDSAYRSKPHDDALVWFATRKDHWLIIVDNADDPSVELFPFIPKSSHGNVIITTRNATYKTLAPNSSHHIEGLAPSEAAELILKGGSYRDNEDNKSHARGIAKALGYFPLALAHAAGYITIHRCLSTYLAMFRSSQAKFLASKPTLPQDYNSTIGATMQISLDSIPQVASDVMILLSRFDISSIPQSIIIKSAERLFRHVVRHFMEDALDPETIEQADTLMAIFCPSGKWLEADFNEIIEYCLQYSLLQVTTQGEARFYSMHILVQTYLQANSARIQQHQVERLVVRLLGSAVTIDNNYKYHAFNRLLFPHLRLVAIHHVTESGDHRGFGQVLFEQGNARLSSEHFERCLALRRGSSGNEHPNTLVAMGDVAACYRDLGRHREALELGVEVLDLRKRVLGDEHPDTIAAMSNLAACYRELGRYMEALELGVEVLDLWKRVLGDEHPNTVAEMSNLAIYYNHLGRYSEALELQVEVLDLRKRVLGHEHATTVLAMANLAACYNHLGRHSEALELQKEGLNLRKRLSGDEHRDTVIAMAGIASSYRHLGRYQEALELEEKVLEMRTELLGEEHPGTIKSMWNLSVTSHKLGRKEQAITLLRAAVTLQEKALGMDHPRTIRMKKFLEDFTVD